MKVPKMTTGNWIFWGVIGFICIILLWVGFIELIIPLWIGAIVAMTYLIWCIFFAPRPDDNE